MASVEVSVFVVCEVVAAVRTRERVHRLPLTVVIDSDGVAIRATSHEKTGSRKEIKRRKH